MYTQHRAIEYFCSLAFSVKARVLFRTKHQRMLNDIACNAGPRNEVKYGKGEIGAGRVSQIYFGCETSNTSIQLTAIVFAPIYTLTQAQYQHHRSPDNDQDQFWELIWQKHMLYISKMSKIASR
jgi:hypothetical protein